MDKITIIIPIYNGEKFIRKGLDSIACQTIGRENLEVLMIDDKSTDRSRDIISDYENRYPGIFFGIFLEENTGHSSIPRNIGLDRATGAYIMFMDQDDWFKEDACERLMAGIRLNDAEIALAWYETKYARENRTIEGHRYLERFEEDARIIEGIGPDIWSNIYKKDLIDRKRIRFPGYALAEDLYFVMACCFEARGIEIIPDIVYHYNIRDDEDLSVFHNKNETLFTRLNEGFRDIRRMLEETGNQQYFPMIITKHYSLFIEGIIHSGSIPLDRKAGLLMETSWLAETLKEKRMEPTASAICKLIRRGDLKALVQFMDFEIRSEQLIQKIKSKRGRVE